MILYGSYARGDYTTDSDIDIALLVDIDRVGLKKVWRFTCISDVIFHAGT